MDYVKFVEARINVYTEKCGIRFEPWASELEFYKGDEIVLHAYVTDRSQDVPTISIEAIEGGFAICVEMSVRLDVVRNGELLPAIWW